MRIGASYGESCRYCGSTEIILEPASSSGHCAVCSHEAVAWAARSGETVDRYALAARAETAAAATHAQTAARAARHRAAARTAVQARGAILHWLRLAPLRPRAVPQP